MQTFWQDLRYGWRTLRERPGFTLVALLSLALGIGANTAIFSVVKAVLLDPLPYAEPDRLVVLDESNPARGEDRFGVSWPNFTEWRAQSASFSRLAAYRSTSVIMTGGEEPVRLSAALVTAELFALLEGAPELGRLFSSAEDRPGASHVALLSHGSWQRRFGGDPQVIGRQVTLDGRAVSVIGVMPEGFQFPFSETEIWMPLGPLSDTMRNRAVHTLGVVARLKDGVEIEPARAEMATIAARIERQFGGEDPGHGVTVTPLGELIVGEAREALMLLLGAVALVLLVACANIAGLLAARSTMRRREIALRAALGASRGRIARQLLTESLLLALIGGAAGLLAALWGVALLLDAFRDLLPRASGIEIDSGVILFALALSVLTGLLFGLQPAWRASRVDLNEALKEGGGGGSSGARQPMRRALVVAEVAVSLSLLAGAGLLVKSFSRLMTVDPGFRAGNLLTLSLTPLDQRYREAEEIVSFYERLAEHLSTLPGIEGVSATSRLPISGGDGVGQLTIEGRAFAPGEEPAASFRRVMPNYFEILGVALRGGRAFTGRDRGEGDFVVIINESMARRFWPAGDALGKRIKIGPPENEPWLTIVGVAGDVRNVGLETGPMLATYEPHAQRPRATMNLLIRTTVDPLTMVSTLRERIRAFERSALVDNISTIERRLTTSVAVRRLNALLVALFAALALLLASVGIYGLLAFEVSARRREIGVRLALGAARRDIVRLIVGEGMRLAAIGIAAGLGAGLLLVRMIEEMLFEVSARDPLTFAATAVAVIFVSSVACYLPARRAARVDPLVALRSE